MEPEKVVLEIYKSVRGEEWSWPQVVVDFGRASKKSLSLNKAFMDDFAGKTLPAYQYNGPVAELVTKLVERETGDLKPNEWVPVSVPAWLAEVVALLSGRSLLHPEVDELFAERDPKLLKSKIMALLVVDGR